MDSQGMDNRVMDSRSTSHSQVMDSHSMGSSNMDSHLHHQVGCFIVTSLNFKGRSSVVRCVLIFLASQKSMNRVATVREKILEKICFPGQGKIREF